MTLWQWFDEHTDEREIFAHAMMGLTVGDAPVIAKLYPFREIVPVCDVGGGRGTLLSELLIRHPHLKGVLCEGPGVLESARTLFEARGVLDRVDLVPGTFFESVPTGADAYLLKNVLHDWDDATCVKILRVVRAAAAPGARLLVAESLVERDSRDLIPARHRPRGHERGCKGVRRSTPLLDDDRPTLLGRTERRRPSGPSASAWRGQGARRRPRRSGHTGPPRDASPGGHARSRARQLETEAQHGAGRLAGEAATPVRRQQGVEHFDLLGLAERPQAGEADQLVRRLRQEERELSVTVRREVFAVRWSVSSHVRAVSACASPRVCPPVSRTSRRLRWRWDASRATAPLNKESRSPPATHGRATPRCWRRPRARRTWPMFVGGKLRVALLTIHRSLRSVPDAITGDEVNAWRA
jgi:hypothetical protein